MKALFQFILFVALLIVAICFVGAAESGGSLIMSICALAIIIALMCKSGMIDLPSDR